MGWANSDGVGMTARPGISTITTVILAFGGGAVVGGFAWWVDQLSWLGIPEGGLAYASFGVLQALGNLPTLWLLLAFAVGSLTERIGVGAALASLSLFTGVGGYYLLIVVASTRAGVDVTSAALAWIAVAAIAGPVLGAAGGATVSGRGQGRQLGAAVLGGSLIAMGLFMVQAHLLVSIVHIVGGSSVVWLYRDSLARRRKIALLTVVIGIAGYAGTLMVFAAVRVILSA